MTEQNFETSSANRCASKVWVELIWVKIVIIWPPFIIYGTLIFVKSQINVELLFVLFSIFIIENYLFIENEAEGIWGNWFRCISYWTKELIFIWKEAKLVLCKKYSELLTWMKKTRKCVCKMFILTLCETA